MLPQISQQHVIDPSVEAFLTELKSSGFKGEIETSYASRITVSTDNSIYQCLPQAVLFPTSIMDLTLLGNLVEYKEFKKIKFSPRGGGTGTNGQSLTQHLVIDLSRHFREILEINIDEKWVVVQPGVVKDALNDALRPLGYFFAPDLSTSNRATIGGMINTDASGQGSLRYGKTSDHVLGLTAVLADGSILETESLTLNAISKIDNATRAANLLNDVANICVNERKRIEEKFPDLNRFLTGYDLKNAFNPEAQTFDLTRILCGSEGTLGFIAEAKLNISPLPEKRVLINVKYDCFDSALRNAPFMVEANALSVETIDSRVLNLARNDVIWHSVKDLLTDVDGKEMQGINLVEFEGKSDDIQAQVDQLVKLLDKKIAQEENGIIGYQICQDLASIEQIYAMRKKAVGLLGATKGNKKPVAFAEDTCVPPEHLADFIAEFRALLDSHSLDYGMFGHVDAGVLHVRPALDLGDIEQERLMRKISDQVVKLVTKYGGLMWGEHGRGYRSEYGETFFGKELFNELRKVKAIFDPKNRMNPGKICSPLRKKDPLVSIDAKKKAGFDREIPIHVKESFQQVIDCNGNGLCFNYDKDSPMCPSMKVSYDRRQSPKGRAAIIREWLRLLNEQGIDPVTLEQELMEETPTVRQLFQKFKNTWLSRKKNYDFSHEVMEAMNGCLACKACATQCPIKIDVPSFRSRFINLYYSRYQRPLKDHLVANIETLLPWMAKAPQLINLFTQPQFAMNLTEKAIGYVDTPALSVPSLQKQLKHHPSTQFNLDRLLSMSEKDCQDHVLIVQDPFTSYYEADVIYDFISLFEILGKKPLLLPLKPNGKAMHIKGFLKKFAKTAKNTADFLAVLAKLNIPMIGIDPALVLCYRDEYTDILGEKRGEFTVQTSHEWLNDFIKTDTIRPQADEKEPWYLFAHCTEKTRLPNAEKDWKNIFAHFGQDLEAVPVGCCGMAGTYGHEADKLASSKAIFVLSWEERINTLPSDRCMATGYSCRSQTKRLKHQKMLHPIQAILRSLQPLV